MRFLALFLALYDKWCQARVKAWLEWLEEWFSISQKNAERGMIVLYLVLMIAPILIRKETWSVMLVGVVAYAIIVRWMWEWHRTPAAARGRYDQSSALRVVRAGVQMFLLFVTFVDVIFVESPPRRLTDYLSGAGQIVYIAIYYATDIASNGKRGRRRKLAMAELKKLFGTEWIPKSLPVPQ